MVREFNICLDINNSRTLRTNINFYKGDFGGSVINISLKKGNIFIDSLDEGFYDLELFNQHFDYDRSKYCHERADSLKLETDNNRLIAIFNDNNLIKLGELLCVLSFSDGYTKTTLGRFNITIDGVMDCHVPHDNHGSNHNCGCDDFDKKLYRVINSLERTITEQNSNINNLTNIINNLADIISDGSAGSDSGIVEEVDPIYMADKENLVTKEYFDNEIKATLSTEIKELLETEEIKELLENEIKDLLDGEDLVTKDLISWSNIS